MPINLVEAAAVVADQFELGQHVADVPLLLDLLVEEPLEERQRGVVLLRGGQFVDGADGGGDLLFVAEAGLEGVQGRFVVALGFGDGLQGHLAAPFHDVFEEAVGVAEFFAALDLHPFAKAGEGVRSKYAAMPR